MAEFYALMVTNDDAVTLCPEDFERVADPERFDIVESYPGQAVTCSMCGVQVTPDWG